MDEVKLIMCFVAGVGTGVLATRAYFKKKYQQIADDEIRSVKRAYPKKDEEAEEPAVIKQDMHHDSSSISYEDLVNAIEQNHQRLIAENMEDSDIPVHPEEDEAVIYEISEEEYAETEISYDKETIHYFVDDGVLFDPGKSKVVDYSIVGDENVELVRTSEDTYSLYFRNDKFGTDYEIIKVAGAYNDGD